MPSPDLVSLFVAPLNRLGATYMVTGAVAAIIYGEPRLTNDIDLVVALSDREARQLPTLFDSHDFDLPPAEVIATETARAWHGHFNVIHIETALKADVYIAGEDPIHHWALMHRRQIQVGSERMHVAPPEYVVLRKLEYFRSGGSDKHVRDITAILQTLGDRIDRDTLHLQIGRLGLGAQWDVVIRRMAEPTEP